VRPADDLGHDAVTKDPGTRRAGLPAPGVGSTGRRRRRAGGRRSGVGRGGAAAAPSPAAVDEPQEALAEPLVLTSPAAGEVRRDLQLRLEGEAAGAARIRWSSPDVGELRGDELVTDDRFTAVTGLLLTGLGAAGVALGRRRASARRDAVRG